MMVLGLMNFRMVRFPKLYLNIICSLFLNDLTSNRGPDSYFVPSSLRLHSQQSLLFLGDFIHWLQTPHAWRVAFSRFFPGQDAIDELGSVNRRNSDQEPRS